MSIATTFGGNTAYDLEGKFAIPARQARPTENTATNKANKNQNNLLWHFNPTIDDDGNVTVYVTERYNQSTKMNLALTDQGVEFTFRYPRQLVIDFVEENCKANMFYQVNLEKALAKRRDELACEIREKDNLPTRMDLEELGYYYAIIEVFRSLGSYDSYYGRGKNSKYDIKSKIGLS